MNAELDKPFALYVEDEEDDKFFMRRAFARAGCDCGLCCAGDGYEAQAYLKGEGSFADRQQFPLPSVVILDLNMPGLSGFDVPQWVRQQPQFVDLPVVIFSSS